MVVRRTRLSTSLKSPLGICLLTGAVSVVLVGVGITYSSPTVHADAGLPRPATTASTTPPAASATPAFVAPPATRKARIFHGLASWYGGIFNGRRTASGERFDMHALTACHQPLPFGSLVRVVNRSNKHSVVVRITDRGDLDEGRIIDLSYAAAEKLAMTNVGLAKVDMQILSLGGNSIPQ